MPEMRIALAQLNLVVGDLDGNVERIAEAIFDARSAQADLIALPELAITGYPPEDLLLKPGFLRAERQALAEVASMATGLVVVVGHTHEVDSRLFNAVSVCEDGVVVGTGHKRHLPNYAVFDEHRWFVEGDGPHDLFDVGGVPIGVSVCEDAWVPDGPVAIQGRGGAELVVNVNASPYNRGKLVQRTAMLSERATEAGCPLVYVNLVGGQDELVFDGGSLVVSADGDVLARAPQFEEALLIVDVQTGGVVARPEHDGDASAVPREIAQEQRLATVSTGHVLTGTADREPMTSTVAVVLKEVDEMYEALVLGTRDYLQKNGFGDVVVGLSGGVDSSLVASIAVDAVGADRVHGVLMPSRYSSPHSISDAEKLGTNLGVDLRTIGIEAAHGAVEEMLASSFRGMEPDLTEENIQSRLRGLLLMALSNKFGWIVLTTGNKSEMAVGYSTLYGDTAGGYAVIKDVFKLWVYELCRWRNERAGREIIPAGVLSKPPSAELRPDQRDDQSLPPYEVLDPILEAYVEKDFTKAELVEKGFDPATVERIVRLVDRAEYKRRQSPIGVRITTKAFGRDRRLPITNRFTG